MSDVLFASGLFIFGMTLLFLMPESMKKNWRELGHKPPAGDAIVMMMRFLGLFLIVLGVMALTGIIDVASITPAMEER